MRSIDISQVYFRMPQAVLSCLIAMTLAMSCGTPQSSLADVEKYTENDLEYRKKFDLALEENEKPLRYGYNYIVTQVPEGYRVRVFHPDKKTLIEDKTCSTPALTLLHGPCRRFWDDGSIREQGEYQYGRKHGIWVESEPGRGKASSGLFLNQRKEGEWVQLDSSGLVESIYTWKDDQRHGKFFLFDTNGQKINEGIYRADTLVAELFKRPVMQKPYLKSCEHPMYGNVYTCSESTLLQAIYLNLRYPSKAKANKIEGAALVQFDIEANGSITHLRVPQGLCNEIEEECKRVFKSMPEWVPARKDNQPVRYTMSIPINFRI